jgi:hypothetical protein
MDWVSPLATIAGVLAGGWIGSRSGERAKVRDLRVDRYAKLLRLIDEGNDAFAAILGVLAAPAAVPSPQEWSAAVAPHGEALANAASSTRWHVAELSLFASRSVSDRTDDILGQWRQMATILADLPLPDPTPNVNGGAAQQAPASTPEPSPPEPSPPEPSNEAPEHESPPAPPWPPPEVVKAGEHFAKAEAGWREELAQLRWRLVGAMRADLGLGSLAKSRVLAQRVRARLQRRRAGSGLQPAVAEEGSEQLAASD